MKVYHVIVEQEGDWYCARVMEDAAVFTQGRTLDEIIANVREVADLMYGEKNVQVELVVPPEVVAPRKPSAKSRRAAQPRAK